MSVSVESRQHLSSNDEHELKRREVEAGQLIDTIVGRHGEYFAEPTNRLDFMQGQSPEDFFGLRGM